MQFEQNKIRHNINVNKTVDYVVLIGQMQFKYFIQGTVGNIFETTGAQEKWKESIAVAAIITRRSVVDTL